jgi:hypothetical protein
MACFLLESDRTFCAIFRRQAQICQETAGRLLFEDGVVVITNEMSASVQELQNAVADHADRDWRFSSLRCLSAMPSFAHQSRSLIIIQLARNPLDNR